MLRLTVLALLLANGLFFAWHRSYLAPWGFAPAQQTEPQRLNQQMRPDAIRLLDASEAKRIESSLVGSTVRVAECVQSALLDEAQVTALRQPLEAWPAGSWSLDAAIEPA